ncbi:SRPBCC family protein [Mycobacterium asiaticum]|uniref:Cyclase n=1 Tax=Mycobacterium asiaticum TaxID=1790 RepID=A0A1A3HNR4_MYCAS|nr:SRPBCC family protein [Mycobacterium asiaticum]OBJ49299.1 cyclase [Mycobacterium asiaticum]OBJ89812.1 cyclase [Mycobacterium asiaticum]
MAITDSREVVVDATPAQIMAVLLDLESLPEWSALHEKIEILTRDERGQPSECRQTVKVMGATDEQVVRYRLHDDGLSWDLLSAKQLRGQKGRYTLTPEGDATRVRLELTVDLAAPVPGFLVRKAAQWLMRAATDGLRKRVLEVKDDG